MVQCSEEYTVFDVGFLSCGSYWCWNSAVIIYAGIGYDGFFRRG